ncbi:recombinase RecT [Pseudomonas chlororaphis]|uniref:recombinase RecT n=1 Tax=Pseudomonas chlororaphis TaxID=587753 RepID=UPI001E37CA25|nr:recombinase RecT [Pseudomonas chlororaphis]MCB2251818.1 recombinase RecT [Pseudomonas chlororaphis]
MSDLAISPTFSLAPKNIDEALKFADYLANSDIVPKDFQRKPANILVAVQWGMELGLQPMQAMQSIAVINGRPSLWGDAVLALARSSPLCEYVTETDDGETATCRAKRRGEEEQVRTFSMADAKLAGLAGKAGPWTQYPKRMRQMRARAFALRDVFPDVLRGMAVAEEVQDIPTEREVAPGRQAEAPKELPDYPDSKLDENCEKWRGLIGAGRTDAERVIATISSKHTISEAQKERIRALAPIEGEVTNESA